MQRVKRMFAVCTMILFVFVVVTSGCSSESSSSKNNVQEADAAIGEDAATNGDSGNTDVSSDTDDVSDEPKDVAADVDQDGDVEVDDKDTASLADVLDDVLDDVTEQDASEDDDVAEQTDVASPNEDPFADRPMGQCIESSECEIMAGGFRSCTRTAPGGLCSGCGDNDCGVMAECKHGTCQALCTSKEDCAPGLTCLSGGTCSLERCVDNKCPTPMFGCSASGYCERVACTQQDDCPALTTCTDGLCIEDRQL